MSDGTGSCSHLCRSCPRPPSFSKSTFRGELRLCSRLIWGWDHVDMRMAPNCTCIMQAPPWRELPSAATAHGLPGTAQHWGGSARGGVLAFLLGLWHARCICCVTWVSFCLSGKWAPESQLKEFPEQHAQQNWMHFSLQLWRECWVPAAEAAEAVHTPIPITAAEALDQWALELGLAPRALHELS